MDAGSIGCAIRFPRYSENTILGFGLGDFFMQAEDFSPKVAGTKELHRQLGLSIRYLGIGLNSL